MAVSDVLNASGWGGARVGSGPKPTKPRKPGVMMEPHPGVSLEPPESLPDEQREFWQSYAGLAIEKRTLTSHTVPAFLLLCELDAEKRAIKATIEQDGRTFLKVTVDGAGVEHQELKAHPLTSSYGQRAKAVEALMARFGLAPFGKAEAPLAKKVSANPWAKVAEK
jgi:hypothetical protein